MIITKEKVMDRNEEGPCPNCGWPNTVGDETFAIRDSDSGDIIDCGFCCKTCGDAGLTTLKDTI